MYNQNPQVNPYQQGGYQNEQNPNNNPNTANYNNNSYNQPPPNQNNYMYPGTNPQMGVFNPGNFRGTIPNPQIQNPNYHKRLSEEQDYSGTLEQGARKGFVSKVYMLVSLQLLLTTLIGYLAYNNQGIRDVLITPAMVIIVSVSLLAVSIIMGCCTDFFRRHAFPLFVVFTLLMAILVAISICGFQSKVILLAAGMTLVLTIGLTIYAWKTDSDLTGAGPYLMIVGLLLLIFGIVAIFWRDPIVHLIYSCLATFLFAIYLIYDTQQILGKGQFCYSLDDAYFAAIQLYTDIIQLFLNLLQIISYFSR